MIKKKKCPKQGLSGGGRERDGRREQAYSHCANYWVRSPLGSHPLASLIPTLPYSEGGLCCRKCEITSGLTSAFGGRIFVVLSELVQAIWNLGFFVLFFCLFLQ